MGWEQSQTTASLYKSLWGTPKDPPLNHTVIKNHPPPPPVSAQQSPAGHLISQLSGKKKSPGVMSGDASGGGGADVQTGLQEWEGGVSAGARGDIRTAGRASRAGSGLARGQSQGVGGAELRLCS